MRDLPRAARALTVTLVAAFMLLGPAYRQVFGGRHEAIRRWTMFRPCVR